MDILRSAKAIDYFTRHYNAMGLKFSVKHGTYTTVIKGPYGDQKFLTHRFGNKVFAAANMIKKDVLESEKGKKIMAQVYKKDNYSNSGKFEDYYTPVAKNIDINSAYASCLFYNDLISEKTYKYIRSLKKDERLPCVGMLAKSHVVFEYEDGVCVSIKPHREPTAQVFYYLISEINYLMNDIEFELGGDFIFYWVDGIFFRTSAPAKKVKTVEEMILEQGYGFKYEDVRDLRYYRNGEKYVCEMMKNKDKKVYQFSDVSHAKEITRNLYEIAKASRDTVQPGRA